MMLCSTANTSCSSLTPNPLLLTQPTARAPLMVLPTAWAWRRTLWGRVCFTIVTQPGHP